MDAVFSKFWEYILYAIRPEKRPPRVSFSPSTLHRELIKEKCKLTPSNNPFFNFLGEMRLKMAADEETYGNLSLHNCSNLSKTAGRIWNHMSEEEKTPYRVIATQQRKLKRLYPQPRKIEKTGKRKRNRRLPRGASSYQFNSYNQTSSSSKKCRESEESHNSHNEDKRCSNTSLGSIDVKPCISESESILNNALMQKVLHAVSRGNKRH